MTVTKHVTFKSVPFWLKYQLYLCLFLTSTYKTSCAALNLQNRLPPDKAANERVEEEKVETIADKSIRSGRLFSNPFGLLGHDLCATTLQGRNATGICYNEMECLVKGGLFAGYCGPPAITGICCVFSSPRCEKRVTQKTAYFTNKSFPRNDLTPYQCQLKIKPLRDMCWIRFDFDVFELSSDGTGGACIFDSVVLLDSPDGPGGQICGTKSGYSMISRVPTNKDLGLSIRTQGPSYRWNIKISQLRCDQISPFPTYSSCGLSNGDTTQFVARTPENLDSEVEIVQATTTEKAATEVNIIKTRRWIRKKQLLPKNRSISSCKHDCNSQEKSYKRRKRKRQQRSTTDESATNNFVSQLSQKKLRSEKFYPSFTARNTFCTSKFRESFKERSIEEDEKSGNILLKIVDGTETAINEYPWMISLQLAGSHFCGGALVAQQWVLTAAHCMDFGNVPDFLQRVVVSFSDHDVTTTSETSSFIRHIIQIVTNAQWHNIPGAAADVALVKLDRPVSYTTNVSPICLPSDPSDTFARQVGVALGWGVTETGDVSDVLRHVELNIIDNITCYENYKALDIKVQADMLCTFSGPTGTENVCSGDSGSPLMVLDGGRFVHVGLTSFALADCTSPFPSVFSRTTSFLQWMAAAITSPA